MSLAPVFFSINNVLSLQVANPHIFIALLICIRHCSKCEDYKCEQNSLRFKTFLCKRQEVRKIADVHSSHEMVRKDNTIYKKRHSDIKWRGKGRENRTLQQLLGEAIAK